MDLNLHANEAKYHLNQQLKDGKIHGSFIIAVFQFIIIAEISIDIIEIKVVE